MEKSIKVVIDKIPGEEWKDVFGYKGIYAVSNLGRIYSFVTCRFLRGKDISTVKDLQKYYRRVGLRKEGIQVIKYVHQIVASHFVENPGNKPIVNHINADKLDNRSENLEWVTIGENVKHAYRLGLQCVGGSRTNAIKVIDTRDNIIYGCIGDAARALGIKPTLLKEALYRGSKSPTNKHYKHIKYYKEQVA